MKNLGLIILTIMLFYSCEDQLDVAPQSNLELGNFFATSGDFDLALTGAYDPLAVHQGDKGFGTYFKGLLMMGRAGTDEIKGFGMLPVKKLAIIRIQHFPEYQMLSGKCNT